MVASRSITDDCTNDSDIDLCLVTNVNCTNPIYADIYGNMEIIMDDLCDVITQRVATNDILSYNKLSDNGSLKAEIDKKGITVYEY